MDLFVFYHFTLLYHYTLFLFLFLVLLIEITTITGDFLYQTSSHKCSCHLLKHVGFFGREGVVDGDYFVLVGFQDTFDMSAGQPLFFDLVIVVECHHYFAVDHGQVFSNPDLIAGLLRSQV